MIAAAACTSNKYMPEQEKSNDISITPPTTQNTGTQSQTPTPSIGINEMQKTSIKAVLGSYQTTILDRDRDRVKNIRLAVNEINGYTMQPGDVFSFNEVVGKRKAQKGYRIAKILVNGKGKEAIGGGICQLSSTLYNAVEKSGLEVVERHPHSKDVYYVPLGQDATVNYGSLDFKFRNTKDYPIKITARAKNGKVNVWIWGVY